jgi:flagella basal body P-ring formation protein FlgA
MFRIVLAIILIIHSYAFAESYNSNSQVFLVPNHPIKKGEIVNDKDFAYDIKNNKKATGYLLESDAYELFHSNNPPVKARKDLAEGQLIKKQDLFFAPLKIKSGDIVQVRFVKNNLKIELSMTALSSGKVGDLIKLQNLQGKIVKGKILSDGTIIIK